MTDYERQEETEELLAPLMVHVTAPADLPEGYTFEALVNDDPDRPFTVEVPEGGVTEGETFLAPVPSSITTPRINAPTGRWKDGLCDFFAAGICHPSLWCAMCCTKIAMAQVMTRMSLTWLGEPGPRAATKNTFKVVLILFFSYILFSSSVEFGALQYSPTELPWQIIVLKFLGSTLYVIWGIYSLCRTRQSVRARYSIPEGKCGSMEDCCCAFWCTCCTISQMARHTGEYENYPGVCCTDTGHPPNTPMTV